MTRLGAYGGSVVVAATAQNTRGVESTHVLPAEAVRAQYEAVTSDVEVDAVKTGMLATAEHVRTVADCLRDHDGPVVVDPVVVATSGDRLLTPAGVDAYDALFEHATLVTPNADETEELVGERPDSPGARDRAAGAFLDRGAEAVLFTGGHVDEGDEVVDRLVAPGAERTFRGPRVEGAPTHGSGCTLASGIAAGLARGDPLENAVERAVGFVRAAIRSPAAVGANGSVNHLVDADERDG